MYRSVTHCVRSSVVVVLLFIRHIGEHYNNENTNKLKKKEKKEWHSYIQNYLVILSSKNVSWWLSEHKDRGVSKVKDLSFSIWAPL